MTRTIESQGERRGAYACVAPPGKAAFISVRAELVEERDEKGLKKGAESVFPLLGPTAAQNKAMLSLRRYWSITGSLPVSWVRPVSSS
ncbi:MAG: hypothetical protein ABUL50_07740, partial [Rhizobacter sp.]